MEMKIGEIAKQSGVQPSTIRYYVQQGLLPEPNKVNKSMAYYSESCIEKIQAIRHLQEKRFFPLSIIRNILRRMDEGMSLEKAEAIEDAVFGKAGTLVDKKEFLARTGLTPEEYTEARQVGLLMPFIMEGGESRFNDEDIRFGRELLKKLRDMGLEFKDFGRCVELGKKIIDHEAGLRKRCLRGKSKQEKMRMTLEMAKRVDLMHSYMMRRLFQRNILSVIEKSLDREE